MASTGTPTALQTKRRPHTAHSPARETQPERLSFLVKQLDLALRAHIEPITRQFDVTASQYSALLMAQGEPGLSSAQLARKSFVTAQAANEIVTSLERKGFIERRADSANHRVRNIHLTRKGTAVLKSCNSQVDKIEEQLISGMSQTKPAALRKSLQSCLHALTAD